MIATPRFPPLMVGVAAEGQGDPFDLAREMAARGCDSGTIVHNVQADRLRAAMVFAPEITIEDAMAMLPLCAVGFQNALGALSPPEVGVHLEWDGGIRVNGAHCGRLRASAARAGANEVPDWLVIGLDLTILQTGDNPGEAPDVTALHDEGCADVDSVLLLESWARHCLVWINRWSEEGNAPLHAAWSGLLHGVGQPVAYAGRSGCLLGTDERFGMLLRDDATTHLVPLSTLLGEDR